MILNPLAPPGRALFSINLPWKVWQYSVRIDTLVYERAYIAVTRDGWRFKVWWALSDIAWVRA